MSSGPVQQHRSGGSGPRQRSGHEHRVLGMILGASFEGVEPLRAQSQHVQVIGGCPCGCPSIELAVDRRSRRSCGTDEMVPVELDVAPVAGDPPGQVICSFATAN